MSSQRWTEQDLRDLQQRREKATAKPAKYRNVKVIVDGLQFDSKHEAAVWRELQLREKAGEIYGLTRQVPFDLRAPAFHCENPVVCRYIADFVYYERATNARITADAKSVATRKDKLYVLKKKWLRIQEGIEIVEL